MGFAEYLKNLRREKGLSLRELAERSGVSNAYISQIERGKRGVPSPDVLEKLAAGLGVSYAELMRAAGYWPKLADLEALAASRGDGRVLEELPPEAVKSLEEFLEYLLAKYGRRKRE